MRRSWPVSAYPSSTSCRASADWVIRSAHMRPQWSRSAGVAKHQVLDVAVMSVRPAALGPRQQPPAGVGLAAVGARGGAVQAQPLVELGEPRPPGESRVVTVAGRDQAAWARDPGHLAQRLHRVGDMLEHLVGVDDVEGAVGEGEAMHVLHAEADIGAAPSRDGRARELQRLLADLGGGDPADQARQVGRDGARAAPISSSESLSRRCGRR